MFKWLAELWKKWWGKNDPIPTPPGPGPQPDPGVEPTDDLTAEEIAQIVTHDAPARALQFKKALQIVDVTVAGRVSWTYNKPCTWPSGKWGVGNNWLFKRIDGKIHGGPGDWLRKGQNYKNAGDFKFVYNGVVTRADYMEEVFIMTSTPIRNNVAHDLEERSSIKKVVWTRKPSLYRKVMKLFKK